MVTPWASPAFHRTTVGPQRCHRRRKWAVSSAGTSGLVKGQHVLPSKAERGHFYMPPASICLFQGSSAQRSLCARVACLLPCAYVTSVWGDGSHLTGRASCCFGPSVCLSLPL